MDEVDDTNLTTDEANLYDRQIRLWGVESQSRLRKSSVLLIGLNLLGAEVAKNLILSGIKQLDLIDDRPLEVAGPRHFLITCTDDARDTKVSNACLARCRALNPLVEIRCLESDSIDQTLPAEKRVNFNDYDLVCFIDVDRKAFNLSKIQELNSNCRKSNVKFVACGCFGFFAYCFFDFQRFEYYQEIESDDLSDDQAETSEPEAKRSKVQTSREKVVITKVEQFASLEEALKESSVFPEKMKKFRRLPGGFYQFQVINKFYEDDRKNDTNDLDQLQLIYEKVVADWASSLRDMDFDIPRFSAKKLIGLSSPVCAIIGGIASQQIIQALSQNEQPINNFVFYDGYDCTVCKLPVD